MKLEDQLLDILKINKNGLTRGELCNFTGKPRTTIYDKLQILISTNKVKKFSIQNKHRGRPKVVYKLCF
ncbi:MAG: hypothetical protein NC935_06285 [Candidatus Omnitrophica bacterium]|nr:hypothetical protein [Candidatus Omnitrophota bacterium]